VVLQVVVSGRDGEVLDTNCGKLTTKTFSRMPNIALGRTRDRSQHIKQRRSPALELHVKRGRMDHRWLSAEDMVVCVFALAD